ncbi:hypothetical protein [Tengunoibacter tsumagoiensis]|uniref:Response regulatory domain-containing protein n=1 Tax=Tengunoibacter tsumagoiensis TaxID=2014871 RepID=A0A402A7Q4_9CHLR|nr:hypothetical protein [Tengunoibacter tsumagoiensis]GCE15099.1 hypothetical protein KTT_49580 [Tengunoibacter tsumagoiensis]
MDLTQKAVIIKPWNSVCAIIELQLRLEHFSVKSFEDHVIAFSELPQLTIKPDLMVIDLDSKNLPSIVTGLHSCCPSARLIVLVDAKETKVAEELRHQHNAHILFKPFTVKALLELIRGEISVNETETNPR